MAFREILEQRKADLMTMTLQSEQNLRDMLADQSEDAQVDFNHPADRVLGDTDYDKGIALIRRERAELAMVSGALARIDQGRYGICEECEQDIPEARLRAIPYTRTCIACKEDLDAAGQPGSLPHDVGNLGV